MSNEAVKQEDHEDWEDVTPPEDWEDVTLPEDGRDYKPDYFGRTEPFVNNLHPFVAGLAEKGDKVIEDTIATIEDFSEITVDDVVDTFVDTAKLGVDTVAHAVKGGVNGVGRFLIVVTKVLEQIK